MLLCNEGDNLSDHSPLFMGLDIAFMYIPGQRMQPDTKPSWKCANESKIHSYKVLLIDMLGNICVRHEALQCNGMTCTKHNDLMNNVLTNELYTDGPIHPRYLILS